MTPKDIEIQLKEGIPIENIITGKRYRKWDKAVKPVEGNSDLLELTKAGYSDAKMATRFSDYLPYKKEIIEEADRILSSEDRDEVCPECGKPVGDEYCFCKFCGKRLISDRTIGDNIKDFRQSLDMTLSEFAKEIGVNVTTISLWETGKKRASVESLKKISDALGISISRIAEGFELRRDLTPKDLIQDDGYECPCCRKPVYLSIGEALSQDIETYEDVRMLSDGNDGYFCIHCGQAIKRPIERDEKKEFESYRFWLDQAIAKARVRVGTRRSVETLRKIRREAL